MVAPAHATRSPQYQLYIRRTDKNLGKTPNLERLGSDEDHAIVFPIRLVHGGDVDGVELVRQLDERAGR